MRIVSADSPPRAFKGREVTSLNHPSIHHELNRPTVRFLLISRVVGIVVEVPKRVMRALVEVDEDLFRLRQVLVGVGVPENHRMSIPKGGHPSIGHRVVDNSGNDVVISIQADLKRHLCLCTPCERRKRALECEKDSKSQNASVQ
jgi:hypothetical protein